MLEAFEQKGIGHVVRELSYRKGHDVRIPDLVFYTPGAHFQDGLLMDAPLLATEVLSPSQRQSELFAKCEAYHSWGVPYCWVIDPVKEIAWEYHRDQPVQCKTGTLIAGEILIPWLSCSCD